MRHSHTAKTRAGVGFVELAIVLVIVGLLTLGGMAKVREAKKSAYRIRATVALEDVHRMEVLHASVHSGYTGDFAALHSLGLASELDPIYRFELDSPDASRFTCTAAANLDRDAAIDSLRIDESGVVATIIKD